MILATYCKQSFILTSQLAAQAYIYNNTLLLQIRRQKIDQQKILKRTFQLAMDNLHLWRIKLV